VPTAAPPCDAYFVCATPRTGSSLLLGLLESTGVAGRPEAYFRVPDEAEWADRWQVRRAADGALDYADFLRAARAAGTTANGVFGAKLMWGTMDELVERLATVYPDVAEGGPGDLALLERAFGRTRFVHLRRDDVLAQAVSWLRAEQTGTWYVGDPRGAGGAPSFDAEEIRRICRTVDEHNAAWEQWFASNGVEPHRVRYEDLSADPVGVTTAILGFLGLEPPEGRVITPRHERRADTLNEQWLERYRAGRAEG